MSALANKLRKAREVKVEAAGFTFIVRRPTDLEMIELNNAKFGRAILPYIIGWEGVSELSMFDGGSPHPLPFDAEACAEWLQDRLDLLSEIMSATFKAYQEHAERLEQAAKN